MPDDGRLSRDRHSVVRVSTGAELYVRVVQEPTATGVPVLLCDGLGCDGYVWRHLLEWLRPHHPVVHWNYRGHGKSPSPERVEELTLDVVLDDLFAVLDHQRLEKAVLVGHSMGVQVCLEAFSRAPGRVHGLGLLFGSWEHPIESWHGAFEEKARPTPSNLLMRALFEPLTRAVIQSGEKLAPFWRTLLAAPLAYEIATRLEVDGKRLSFIDFGPYLQTLAHMDPRVFAQLARALASHSADAVLERVNVPTLVVGGTRDTFTPGWRSATMARRIPGAELLLIDNATHTGPLEYPTLIGQRVTRFLGRIGGA